MNILYVYAHPNPESLNASIKALGITELQKLGHTVKLSDLYSQNFKALADNRDFENSENIDQQYFIAQHNAYQNHNLHAEIQTEIEKIKWADHIIFQFPLWWFSTPAILKGWFDRVFIKGFAYDADHKFDTGLLKCKTASFTVTTQSPESAYQPNGVHAHNITDFLLPIMHTLRLTGIQPLTPHIIYSAFNLSQNDIAKMMQDYQQYLDTTWNT